MNQTLLVNLLYCFVVYLIVLLLVSVFGQFYVSLFTPIYHGFMELITPNFSVTNLGIETRSERSTLALSIVVDEPFQVGEYIVPKGVAMSASTDLGHILQHPIIVYTLLFSWWIFKRKILLTSLFFVLPFLIVLELIDIPLLLLGSLQDLLLFQLAPTEHGKSPWVFWIGLLNGGGRLVLAIIAVFLTIFLHKYICDRLKKLS